MLAGSTLNIGDIVQLDPEKVGNKAFAGCFMVVTEPKSWGGQGYVLTPTFHPARDGVVTFEGKAYYRAKWEEMEKTGGQAVWMVDRPGDGAA